MRSTRHPGDEDLRDVGGRLGAVFSVADSSFAGLPATVVAATVTSLLILGVPDARARELAEAQA